MFSLNILKIFAKPTVVDIVNDRLYAARRGQLDHSMTAAHHQALANMYTGQIATLQGMLSADPDGLVPAVPVDSVTPIRSRAKKIA